METKLDYKKTSVSNELFPVARGLPDSLQRQQINANDHVIVLCVCKVECSVSLENM